LTAAEIAERLGAKKTGTGWAAKCPGHQDKNASLAISEGDDGRTLLHCHAGCDFSAVVSAAGLKPADLFPAKPSNTRETIVARYDYRDESGKVLFCVGRYVPKTFKQGVPDASRPLGFRPVSVSGIRKVLYRLPEILQAVQAGHPVFVTEGEKDADTLAKHGLTATTNAGGAKAPWLQEYTATLRGVNVTVISDKDAPGRKHAADVASHLQGAAQSVRVIECPDVNGQAVKDAHDYIAAGASAADLMQLAEQAPEWTGETATPADSDTQPAVEKAPPTLGERLVARRFDIANPPKESAPVFFVGGVPVSTVGNITTISAPPKTAKTTALEAVMAATMTPPTREADLLGFTGFNADGKAVIHLDTEQSPCDHHNLVKRALRRAGVALPPPWLFSFCLTGFPAVESRRCVRAVLELGREQCGGVHSVLLDGVADFVCDVNDPAESNSFTAELHGLAIEYAAPCVGVIHLNPGTEKTRGHLGSQLERKAETNLRLEKDGESIVIWADKNRRAPILKKDGPRFAWSDAAQMHVSVVSGQAAADVEAETAAAELAADLFLDKPQMRYADLVSTIKTRLIVSEPTAGRKVRELSRRGVIQKQASGYYKQRVSA
jgi:hypothetical protein